MNRSGKARRRIVLGTASIGVALALAGCDSSVAPDPTTSQVPGKAARVDKNAPLEQRVRGIIVEQLGLKKEPKVTDRLVEDLGADSLDCVELVMTMEEEFNLEIPDEEAAKMKTLADIAAYLGKKSGRGQRN